jgi:membrane associated rhomboid family serine protease
MLPLAGNTPQRRFPIVNTALIALNVAVFVLYQLPDFKAAVLHASFYPASLTGWEGPLPWYVSWLTAMFLHAGWSHLLGNMVFLWVFGDSIELAFGRARYLALYLAGGFAAMFLQAGMTLLFSDPSSAYVPCLGASGAIAAVLGAYFVLFPSRPLVLFPIAIVVPAWLFLGGWFLYQAVMAFSGLLAPANNGVAFFAHVGGFVFGFAATKALVRSGRLSPFGRATGWGTT